MDGDDDDGEPPIEYPKRPPGPVPRLADYSPRGQFGDPVPRHSRNWRLDDAVRPDPIDHAALEAARVYHDAVHERRELRQVLVHLAAQFARAGLDADDAYTQARRAVALISQAVDELEPLPPKPD